MLGLTSRRMVILRSSAARAAGHPPSSVLRDEEFFKLPPSNRLLQKRFLDIHQMLSKEAIEKERARIKDEMSRGYFADIGDMKKHGGKIAMANATVIPAIEALKFPTLDVNFSDGRSLTLPFCPEQCKNNENKLLNPSASLVCLSFRASSQEMVESWTKPFINAFSTSSKLNLYEVSLIDSWFLSLGPIKRLLLQTMQRSKNDGKDDKLRKQIVYSFGDNYYFRKELKILNLLTAYIFLLDRLGRIRWQAFGLATEEEILSLVSLTSQLLEEN